eukprot:scaffold304_cov409-Prasinococcus_capsulatus_cf.AAC.6
MFDVSSFSIMSSADVGAPPPPPPYLPAIDPQFPPDKYFMAEVDSSPFKGTTESQELTGLHDFYRRKTSCLKEEEAPLFAHSEAAARERSLEWCDELKMFKYTAPIEFVPSCEQSREESTWQEWSEVLLNSDCSQCCGAAAAGSFRQAASRCRTTPTFFQPVETVTLTRAFINIMGTGSGTSPVSSCCPTTTTATKAPNLSGYSTKRCTAQM